MKLKNPPQTIALLGGTFNPPHYGHLRLAVEVHELIRPRRLDFIPTAVPPHKKNEGILPFDMRADMLEKAIRPWPRFRVNRLETERKGPSYTVDTLRLYRRSCPGDRLFFVLGAEDFSGMESWKDWKEMPALADLLVVARQGVEAEDFAAAAKAFWPQAASCPEKNFCPELPGGVAVSYSIPDIAMKEGGKATGLVHYLPLPRLDISASLIRERWLEGRSIDYWVPPEVIEILEDNEALARTYWDRKSDE